MTSRRAESLVVGVDDDVAGVEGARILGDSVRVGRCGALVGDSRGAVGAAEHRSTTFRRRPRRDGRDSGHGDRLARQRLGQVHDPVSAAVDWHAVDRCVAQQRARPAARQRIGHGVEVISVERLAPGDVRNTGRRRELGGATDAVAGATTTMATPAATNDAMNA